jgi:hypothetical protein
MLGKFGADDSRGAAEAADRDARSVALLLMSQALAQLDSDSRIPALIGAYLQSAIDALWINGSDDPRSIHLH